MAFRRPPFPVSTALWLNLWLILPVVQLQLARFHFTGEAGAGIGFA
jgi:hypothetical protein